jgi:hypothetical protein
MANRTTNVAVLVGVLQIWRHAAYLSTLNKTSLRLCTWRCYGKGDGFTVTILAGFAKTTLAGKS